MVILDQAVSLAISRAGKVVLSAYQLGLLVFGVLVEGAVDGRRLRTGEPKAKHFRQVLQFLTSYGLLAPVRGLPQDSAFVTPSGKSVSAEDIACAVDPFAYVSHLGAMEAHGLTDRVSQTLFLSSPDRTRWRQFADERMAKDLGERLEAYLDARFPVLVRTRMDRIDGRPVHIAHSVHLGAFRKSAHSELRIATVGRTFLDMLRQPDLCGGIHHVLGVYRDHAGGYLNLIVDEFEQHGGPIDKVRAGYVLEELCGLSSPRIEAWQRHIARGGSRKLVADNEYAARHSERWSLSLNAD